jgi:hypothetical protein
VEGGRNVSSSNLSGRGFLLPVNPRSAWEAAAGPRVFLAKGLSCVDFLLPPGVRAVGLEEIPKVSSSNFSDRGFLLPLNPRSAAEAAPGWRLFLPERVSGEALRLP